MERQSRSHTRAADVGPPRSISRVHRQPSDHLLHLAITNQAAHHADHISSHAPPYSTESDTTLTRLVSSGPVHRKNIPMVHERPHVRRLGLEAYERIPSPSPVLRDTLSSDRRVIRPLPNVSPFTLLKDNYETKRSLGLTLLNTKSTGTPESGRMFRARGTGGSISTHHSIDHVHSEPDDSDSDEFTPTQYDVDLIDTPRDVKPRLLQDVINDINSFQSNFVRNDGLPTPPVRVSRTQRKVLDYKDLYPEESEAPRSTDYSTKIQHDTVVLEYTSIRLRFASKVVTKSHMRPDTGVLGFINRYVSPKALKPSKAPSQFPLGDTPLDRLWADEMARQFPSPSSDLINSDWSPEDADIYLSLRLLRLTKLKSPCI